MIPHVKAVLDSARQNKLDGRGIHPALGECGGGGQQGRTVRISHLHRFQPHPHHAQSRRNQFRMGIADFGVIEGSERRSGGPHLGGEVSARRRRAEETRSRQIHRDHGAGGGERSGRILGWQFRRARRRAGAIVPQQARRRHASRREDVSGIHHAAQRSLQYQAGVHPMGAFAAARTSALPGSTRAW